MARIAALLPLLALLAACATEITEDSSPPLPMPPPAPPRPPALRQAVRPPADTAEAVAAAAPATPAPDQATAAAEPPRREVWRVARDGVVGCANPATLAVLGEPADRTPRALAEARAAGGCRTTFRINEWVVEASEAETVRLRLTNGTPLTLWFRRGDVVAP